ncbi:hypothetical protein CDD81_6975 [Ophiocordyceps australis]|uniref:Mitochondrial genome maintenance protein MGM101 n=1 Tax=Ophiocordyceps australis TaxID=1399860 RepID=A0A2C5YG77_9HYPO|nr:hypothetical protein CDD81_6975 [Ophiocordyceps australis]
MSASRRIAWAVPRRLPHRTNLMNPLIACYSTASPAPASSSSLSSTNMGSAKPNSFNNGNKIASPPQNLKPTPSPATTTTTTTMPLVNPPPVTFSYGKEEPPRPAPRDGVSIDWTNSYHGVASRAVTAEQYRSLMQPISEKDIEVKPDGIIYLPEIKYRRRLNETFGPLGWGLVPRSNPVVNNNLVTREYALIVEGRFASQAQGENPFFGPDQLSSAIEGCKSNALMRCCKDLGISSELWDPHFIRNFKKTSMVEVWVEHVTTKKKRLQWYRKGQVDVVYPYKAAGR